MKMLLQTWELKFIMNISVCNNKDLIQYKSIPPIVDEELTSLEVNSLMNLFTKYCIRYHQLYECNQGQSKNHHLK